jgi:putative ABC transport system permease protein
MGQATITPDLRYLAVLGVLVAAAAGVAYFARLQVSRAMVVAAVRALIQLAAVSFVIVFVLKSWGLTGLFIAAMLTVASATSARRAGRGWSALWVAVPIVAGVLPVLGLVVGSGTVPLSPIAVVPVAGILVGGAMTATTLAARRALDTLRDRYSEFEAMVALGYPERRAARDLCRPSGAEALLPALDQTRTVGLVTLPGAFVGVLLGGATPVQAGAAQLLVLVGLLAVEAASVTVTVELIARRRIHWRTHEQNA